MHGRLQSVEKKLHSTTSPAARERRTKECLSEQEKRLLIGWEERIPKWGSGVEKRGSPLVDEQADPKNILAGILRSVFGVSRGLGQRPASSVRVGRARLWSESTSDTTQADWARLYTRQPAAIWRCGTNRRRRREVYHYVWVRARIHVVRRAGPNAIGCHLCLCRQYRRAADRCTGNNVQEERDTNNLECRGATRCARSNRPEHRVRG